nr:type II toxin-antitoxin system HicA family toxin [Clostridium neonatale]DAW05994.1 MAG TPA: HICA protein [Caudoviricetes sp.]
MNRNKINELIAKFKKNMNLQEYINFVDVDITNSFIDLIADNEVQIQDNLEKIALIAYENSENIDKFEEVIWEIEDINNFNIDLEIKNINQKNEESSIYFNNIKLITNGYTKVIAEEIKKDADLFLERISIYNREFSNINIDSIFKRVLTFQNKLIQIADSFCRINCNILNKHSENLSRMGSLLKILEKRYRIESKELLKKIKEFKRDNKKQKIFNYKELNSLAEKNGYIYRNYNGDHKIYIHQKSNKIVVIPQHTIGYGLSMEIQNQIKINAIFKAA